MIDNKNIEKINRMLQKQIVQRFSVLAVAALVIGSVAYFGINRNEFSSAASVGVLSMTSSAGSSAVTVGSNVNVTLRADSGLDNINAVQASVTYDATKLQYVSMTEGTAFPTVAATSTSTPGLVRVARGTTPAGVTGANDIVTVTFKVLGSSGTTALAYDPAFSYIVRSSDSVNILTSNTGATIAMKLPAPTVASITPTSGLTTGGTAVTITGTNFVSGATVTIGGVAATSVSVSSATTITANTPANTAGSKSVTVTNPDGQSGTRTNSFTYVLPAPTITTVVPTSGLVTGGTSITINGTNFVTGATVTVGGVAATNVVVASATSITATIPANTAGLKDVTVRNPDGQTVTKTGAFTYNNLAPTVSTVAPASGLTSGGTVVTISGANFISGATVKIGTLNATGVTFQSSTSLTATTPAQAAGVYSVTVTNPDQQAGTKTNAYTYVNPAPTIGSVSPTSGLVGGGTEIVITGTNFLPGAIVTIGGIQASAVSFQTSTQLSATTPVGTPGPKTVVVTNADGQSTTSTTVTFNYLSNPGDANNDGRVNAIDLSILISNDAKNYPPADFNGDGTVGSADLAILIGRWTW